VSHAPLPVFRPGQHLGGRRMAFGLPQDQRSQVLLLLIVACIAGGYFFYDKVQSPLSAQLTLSQKQIDSLTTVLNKAKADLASGSVESLRRQVETYRATLGLMRQLVPEQSEVTTLLDDISRRAKIRGITLGKFQPLSVTPGPALPLPREPGDTGQKTPQAAFDIYRYRLGVYGHYDDVGEFLTDVASLPRIMVPQGLELKPASLQAQKLLGDTLGALLEADFDLRTYVKRAPPPRPTARAAAARP
jgi:Tfp pilus assembly protein PilO